MRVSTLICKLAVQSTAKHTKRQLMACFMREVYSSFNVRKINCVVQEVLLSTLFTHSLWIEDIKSCYCLDMCRCTWDANFENLKHTRHTMWLLQPHIAYFIIFFLIPVSSRICWLHLVKFHESLLTNVAFVFEIPFTCVWSLSLQKLSCVYFLKWVAVEM